MICNDLFFFFLNFLILKDFSFFFVAIEKCVCVTKLHNWLRELLSHFWENQKLSWIASECNEGTLMDCVDDFQLNDRLNSSSTSRRFNSHRNQSRNDFECSYAEPLLISLWRIHWRLLSMLIPAFQNTPTTIKREIIIKNNFFNVYNKALRQWKIIQN